jgi:hypothetical protein
MAHQFQKHYTLAEARALLPQVRRWLGLLAERRGQLHEQEKALQQLMSPGLDVGGPVVNAWLCTLVSIQQLLLEFYRRDIQIKDLERGLLDFPTLRDGKEVFLCWEKSEQDIEFWHDLESGYAGREKLEED